MFLQKMTKPLHKSWGSFYHEKGNKCSILHCETLIHGIQLQNFDLVHFSSVVCCSSSALLSTVNKRTGKLKLLVYNVYFVVDLPISGV